jgi:hypothetical protein
MSIVEEHFPYGLISPSVAAGFPGYTVRPLARHDYTKGFLECLEALSDVGPVTEAQFWNGSIGSPSTGRGCITTW